MRSSSRRTHFFRLSCLSLPTHLRLGAPQIAEAPGGRTLGTSGGDPAWLTTLNALRAASPMAAQLPPLVDPGTTAARQDMLFHERAMWMYLTAHRLGDMRRLIRQYQRPTETVFPTGAYFKGGSYGTDVNLPLPFSERNNGVYTGCLDRNA